MATLQLRVEGENAQQSAELLQQFITDEWGVEANVTTQRPATDHATKDLGTVLTFIKIIIALPRFLDAVDDLAQRMQAKERLEALITKAQELTDPTQTVWLEVNGIPYPLKTENLVEILNKLEE